MPDILLFLLQVLATYRIARLVAVDNGPFDCFLWVRQGLGKIAGEGSSIKALADLVNCQFCVGVWVALILALIFQIEYPWWISWLGIAGGQAVLADMVYKE